ncbi:MAG: bifunctional heptose 7-phosphate kinase/heptose 1-phosphate adenyltransferase, partial [Phycisphaerales bacterium JB059]
MRLLLDALNHWKPFRAIVVGDFMLDRLVHGEASRLSADAPVPVLRVERREDQAGGAANLCMNLRAMKGEVVAIGLVGEDAEGGILRRLLEDRGVETHGLLEDASRPTTSKQNLIGLAQARHPQKMFRVDVESTEAPDEQTEARMLAAFEAALPGADVVCLEDYHKGVCSPALCAALIERAKAAGVPVFVDPASITDYAKYRGATAITPNRTEAERATGMPTHADASPEHNVKLARTMLERLDLDAVVLTLDRHGALLLTREDPTPIPVPTVARAVYDVTGAGDMMLAGLAAARANGIEWVGSVELAN